MYSSPWLHGRQQQHQVCLFRVKGEAKMTPKQYFDFGEAGLRHLGFFKKGWCYVGEDGQVVQSNTGRALFLDKLLIFSFLPLFLSFFLSFSFFFSFFRSSSLPFCFLSFFLSSHPRSTKRMARSFSLTQVEHYF